MNMILNEENKTQLETALTKEFPFNAKQIDSFMDYLSYQDEFDREKIEENIHEIADGLTEIYTHDLITWLGEEWERSIKYCNRAIKEGFCDGKDLSKTIMAGNYLMHEEKLYQICNFSEKFFEELEKPEEEV